MKLRYKISGALLAVFIMALAWLGWFVSHDNDCVPAGQPGEDEASMAAIRHGCFGGPEVLELARISKPVADANEILVRIEAAGVNPLDWHYLRGTPYIMRLMGAGIGTPADMRLGADFAGVVEAVGERTRVGRLMQLVEDCSQRQAPIVRLADRAVVVKAVMAYLQYCREPRLTRSAFAPHGSGRSSRRFR